MDAFIFLKNSQVGLGVLFKVLLGCFWEALGLTLATLGGLGCTLRALFGALRHLELLRVDSEATLGTLGREFGCLLGKLSSLKRASRSLAKTGFFVSSKSMAGAAFSLLLRKFRILDVLKTY